METLEEKLKRIDKLVQRNISCVVPTTTISTKDLKMLVEIAKENTIKE